MIPDFQEIVTAELMAHNIKLCRGGCFLKQSHSRGFAVPDHRTIHYSKRCATRSTLLGFLHEIGHIVKGHGHSCQLQRWEKESQAEEYAKESLRALGITVPRKRAGRGRRYILRMKRWGNRIAAGRRSHDEARTA